ncbi:hypothetical protein B0T25DRAFT_555675 [Lasiosphaeria hispida]|uniref:Uncharacterized protein n=1 Tax=Lasiosphaeria hispida TaxID=260671 RepID=A0AAJ0M9L3_9PEZI|nr:hypothetical protein B0T25DRAFT_555675 [Lasiosphaeria hispida]
MGEGFEREPALHRDRHHGPSTMVLDVRPGDKVLTGPRRIPSLLMFSCLLSLAAALPSSASWLMARGLKPCLDWFPKVCSAQIPASLSRSPRWDVAHSARAHTHGQGALTQVSYRPVNLGRSHQQGLGWCNMLLCDWLPALSVAPQNGCPSRACWGAGGSTATGNGLNPTDCSTEYPALGMYLIPSPTLVPRYTFRCPAPLIRYLRVYPA